MTDSLALAAVQPSNSLEYIVLILVGGLILGLVILGKAWIAKSKPYEGEERRVNRVEANVERFAHVEALIGELAKSVAVLTEKVSVLSTENQALQRQIGEMLEFQRTLDKRFFDHISKASE